MSRVDRCQNCHRELPGGADDPISQRPVHLIAYMPARSLRGNARLRRYPALDTTFCLSCAGEHAKWYAWKED